MKLSRLMSEISRAGPIDGLSVNFNNRRARRAAAGAEDASLVRDRQIGRSSRSSRYCASLMMRASSSIGSMSSKGPRE